MNNNKVKMMSEGAMLAAAFGVIAIINIATGTMFDALWAYLMTGAIAYYTVKYNYKAGLIVDIVCVVVFLMVGELFFLFYSVATMLMGIFWGYCYQKKKSKRFCDVGMILMSLIKNYAICVGLGGLVGIDIILEGQEMLNMIISIIPGLSNIITAPMVLIAFWLLFSLIESKAIDVYVRLVSVVFNKIQK